MWLTKMKSILATLSVALSAPSAHADVPLNGTPDSPQSFGYKTSWFSVKAQDPRRVAKVLGLVDLRQANWASGLAAAYSSDNQSAEKKYVFVSPPVKGWIFVVSLALPYPDKRTHGRDAETDIRFDSMLGALMRNFEEVQFYGSYRVVGLEAWARAKGGKVERLFCYADGDVYANLGPQTAVEKQLKFLDLSEMSPEAATSAIFSKAEQMEAEEQRLIASGFSFQEAREQIEKNLRGPLPTEGDAAEIASHWSVDPTRLEGLQLPPSTGFIAFIPTRLPQ